MSSPFTALITLRPHVWHIHEQIADEFPSLETLRPVILGVSDRVVCVSYISQQFNSKTILIYNGLDVGKMAQDVDEAATWKRQYLDSGSHQTRGHRWSYQRPRAKRFY